MVRGRTASIYKRERMWEEFAIEHVCSWRKWGLLCALSIERSCNNNLPFRRVIAQRKSSESSAKLDFFLGKCALLTILWSHFVINRARLQDQLLLHLLRKYRTKRIFPFGSFEAWTIPFLTVSSRLTLISPPKQSMASQGHTLCLAAHTPSSLPPPPRLG